MGWVEMLYRVNTGDVGWQTRASKTARVYLCIVMFFVHFSQKTFFDFGPIIIELLKCNFLGQPVESPLLVTTLFTTLYSDSISFSFKIFIRLKKISKRRPSTSIGLLSSSARVTPIVHFLQEPASIFSNNSNA